MSLVFLPVLRELEMLYLNQTSKCSLLQIPGDQKSQACPCRGSATWYQTLSAGESLGIFILLFNHNSLDKALQYDSF